MRTRARLLLTFLGAHLAAGTKAATAGRMVTVKSHS